MPFPRGRPVRSNAGYVTAPAGSWRAAGDRFAKLTRPATIPQAAYQRPVTVSIGNDGIAAPVVFSGAGTAVAFCGPSGIGASWQPAQANLYTSVGVLDAALASCYAGPQPIAQYQVASSIQGGGAQVALGGVTLVPGWGVWAVWSGGTPGAIAYLVVSGSKSVLTT